MLIVNSALSFLTDRGFFDERSLFASNSEQGGISRVEYDDDNYKILVNVEKYKPEVQNGSALVSQSVYCGIAGACYQDGEQHGGGGGEARGENL